VGSILADERGPKKKKGEEQALQPWSDFVRENSSAAGERQRSRSRISAPKKTKRCAGIVGHAVT